MTITSAPQLKPLTSKLVLSITLTSFTNGASRWRGNIQSALFKNCERKVVDLRSSGLRSVVIYDESPKSKVQSPKTKDPGSCRGDSSGCRSFASHGRV